MAKAVEADHLKGLLEAFFLTLDLKEGEDGGELLTADGLFRSNFGAFDADDGGIRGDG